MATHLLKFGTLDLTAYCSNIAFVKENVVNTQSIPGRHGWLITSSVTANVTIIRATGTFSAASVSALRDIARAWNGYMGTDRQNLYAVHADRFYRAYKRKFEITYNPGAAAMEMTWLIEWVCDDPFIFEDDGGGGAALSTTAFSLGALDPNPKNFTVNNTGDRLAFVLVAFTAGAVNGQNHIIRNVDTGKSSTYSGSLAVSDVLAEDFRNFTIQKNGVNDLTNWNGGVIYLNPGVNNMQIEGRLGVGAVQYVIKH